MQTNIQLFEYLNAEYYLNSKFDIQVFVCYNKYAYRANRATILAFCVTLVS